MISKALKILTFSLFLSSVLLVQDAQANTTWNIPKEVVVGTLVGAAAGGFVHAPLVGAVLGGGLASVANKWGRITHFFNIPVDGITNIHAIQLDGELILIVPSDAIFEVNTAEFRPGGEEALDNLAEILYRHPAQNIHISANLDPINAGLKWHHASLSDQQAEQVASYFWMKGIRQGNVHRQLSYCGDDVRYPVASNQLLAGMITNRRIQITVYSDRLSHYPKSAPTHTLWSSWSGSYGEDVITNPL